MKMQQKRHPLEMHEAAARHVKGQVWKELNQWSRQTWGVSFPVLLAIFSAVEYFISRMPQA